MLAQRSDVDAMALFAGDGEMRALCRAFDWSATPLGPVAEWPPSLRTATQLVLAADLPMSLHWGRELIAIYNDARARIIGPRHPGALGRSALEQFPERHELHEPLFARVQNGEAFTLTDTWIPIVRDGGLTEACFTVSFSPVRDERGDVGGVLAVLIETTDRVQAEAALRVSEARQRFLLTLHDRLRSLSDPEAIQYEAARLLGEHLGAKRVGYAEIEPDGLHSVVTRNYTAGVRGIEGRYRVADFPPVLLPALRAGQTVARNDVAHDTGLSDAERAAHEALEVGATVDVPLVKEGRLVAVLFMHHRHAHTWTTDELSLLEGVAERTWEAVERARAESRLRAGEARLQLALDIAELGTWEIDLATGAATLDTRGAEIVGLEPGHAGDASRAQVERVHPDDLARLQGEVAAGVAARAPFDLTYRVILTDGRVRHVASRARVLADAAGRPLRLVGTNRDVTDDRLADAERARLFEAERAARHDAEAANRAKSEFLAVMSHELRTPLNAIGGYAELIELGIHGPVTEPQRTALTRIQQSQRHLLGLINQVLNYTRIDAGAVRYDVVDVPVAEALATAEALVLPQVRARGLVYLPAVVPADLSVRADSEKLQQILLNLLGNAIKFTDRGGEVRVICSVQGDTVSIAVIDTGIGIAPEKLVGIFEPFVQIDQRLTRANDGVGLGLAISRELARGMGGDLTAASVPDEGSTFTLTLPQALHGRGATQPEPTRRA